MVGAGSRTNRPHVRVRSPVALHSKVDDRPDPMASGGGGTGEVIDKTAAAVGRKIMIVVDPSVEAKVALQWALSHAVQPGDVIVLLFVDKKDKPTTTKLPHFLTSITNSCQLKKPQVQIETVVIAERKEKGARIVEEARKQGVAMLVLGQKRTLMTWRLLMSWVAAGQKRPVGNNSGVVEYCIQNATCMAVAVRRKSKKLGGYLITTKRQKDFWLLA